MKTYRLIIYLPVVFLPSYVKSWQEYQKYLKRVPETIY